VWILFFGRFDACWIVLTSAVRSCRFVYLTNWFGGGMAAQVVAMEPAAAAGEGQRFKRIPRQAWEGNLDLDPLVRLASYLLVSITQPPDLLVRVLPV
jgi:hypothetical protein